MYKRQTLVYAQQQKISVSIKELPLKEAINQIAQKASMNVAYSKEFVDTNRKVSLEVKDTEVNRALTLLPVSYTHLDVYKRQGEGIFVRSVRQIIPFRGVRYLRH